MTPTGWGASTSGRALEPATRNSLQNVRKIAYATSFVRASPTLRARPTVAASPREEAPEWLRMLEEDAAGGDEEAATLLDGAGGDPSTIQDRMRKEMDALHSRITGERGAGEDAPVQVAFRQMDPFDLWVWLELYTPPSSAEIEMLQEVVNSWFMLGRLGGFNSSNLQVMYAGGDAEGLQYDTPEPAALVSSMHDIAPLETKGCWARFWVDMGTADELALDVLVNSMMALSREQVGIRQLVVGGENDDWEVPRQAPPRTSMDPSW